MNFGVGWVTGLETHACLPTKKILIFYIFNLCLYNTLWLAELLNPNRQKGIERDILGEVPVKENIISW